MTALLLIAHGSRRAEANADLDWLADALRQRRDFGFVTTSYLELAEPTIAVGGTACVTAGATNVVMMPYFLSPGVHVREDLIHARDDLNAQFPGVTFTLAEPLGRHPLLIDVVVERCRDL